MSFFGIQVGLLQVSLQDTNVKNYYCNLTATRMEVMENIGIMDILTFPKPRLTPKYGTQWNAYRQIYWLDNTLGNTDNSPGNSGSADRGSTPLPPAKKPSLRRGLLHYM